MNASRMREYLDLMKKEVSAIQILEERLSNIELEIYQDLRKAVFE